MAKHILPLAIAAVAVAGGTAFFALSTDDKPQTALRITAEETSSPARPEVDVAQPAVEARDSAPAPAAQPAPEAVAEAQPAAPQEASEPAAAAESNYHGVEPAIDVKLGEVLDKEGAKALALAARETFQELGREAAIARFQSPDGGFTIGGSYIFAVERSGQVLAHGAVPAEVGINISDITLPSGRNLYDTLFGAVKDNGEGWEEVLLPQPGGSVKARTIYVVAVDDGDVVLIGGTYNP